MNTDSPTTPRVRSNNPRHIHNRANPLWLQAINQTLAIRGHDRRLTSITKSLWDRHIEPLLTAVQDGPMSKRKRLGYQVIDADDEMPDGWVSFGIYSLADCQRVIDEDKERWQLVTIFEGDIEEPTFM